VQVAAEVLGVQLGQGEPHAEASQAHLSRSRGEGGGGGCSNRQTAGLLTRGRGVGRGEGSRLTWPVRAVSSAMSSGASGAVVCM
jgi:hypothetical protein